MEEKELFDHEPHVQNYIIKEILINKVGYLKPYHHFSDNKITVYQHIYSDGNQWPLKDLAHLLVILLQRSYLIPVHFKADNPMHPMGVKEPYFIFEEDFEQLTDKEKNAVELVDLNEAAKVFQN